MRVRDIMTGGIEFIPASYSLSDAAKKMRELDIGALAVSHGETIVGILTDRDIVIRAVAQDHAPETTLVQEIMTEPVYTRREDDGIEEAAQIMEDAQVRRLVVEDHERHVTGMISTGDIASHAGKELSGEVMQGISEPSQPRR